MDMEKLKDVENIKKILERNDYQVTAFATDNGCLVIYPERVEEPTCPSIKVQYEYTPDGLHTVILDDNNSILKDRLYVCPNYAQRLLMFSHIISRCIQINYAVALIGFMEGDQGVDEERFYEACTNSRLSPEEAAIEDVLKPIIIQCIFTVFTPLHEEAATQAGALEGFIAIRNILTGHVKTVKTEEPYDSKEENSVGG